MQAEQSQGAAGLLAGSLGRFWNRYPVNFINQTRGNLLFNVNMAAAIKVYKRHSNSPMEEAE